MNIIKIYILEILFLSSVLLLQAIKLPKGVVWKKNIYKILLICWIVFIGSVSISLLIHIPLFRAISENNIEAVSQLLDKHPDWINADKFWGDTPLHTAVQVANLDIIKLLINRGADVNEVKDFGVTPLHIAVYNNNIEIAKLLLNSGADINSIGYRQDYTPLHIAICGHNMEMIKFLIQNNADLSIKDGKGRTSIEHALENKIVLPK